MQDSGLTEDSEYLTEIPRRYFVTKNCQEAIVTAPAIPKIKAGSNYGDEMIVDVTLMDFLQIH